MAIETVSRTAKVLYDEQQPFVGKQLYQALFPQQINTTEASFQVDYYTGGPEAMLTVRPNESSRVKVFEAGSGYQYSPYISSEKTPIDAQLMEAVMAGLEPTAPYSARAAEYMNQIVSGPRGFINRNHMQRNKAAMDVLVNGTYTQINEAGTLSTLDFSRDADLTETYDFTAEGATFDAALVELIDLLEAQGTPTDNLAFIMGKSWLQKVMSESAVITKINAFQNSNLMQFMPEQFQGIDGLRTYGWYTPAGSLHRVQLLAYTPTWQYNLAGTASDYIAATKAVLFNASMLAWEFNCGIPVLRNGKNVMETGDLVFATDSQNDPPIEWVIARNRFAFVPGNINHTCVSTGTFS